MSSAKPMRSFRTPALLAVAALAFAAMFFERNNPTLTLPATVGQLAHTMPVAQPGDALSTTWFCAGGTARGSKQAPDPKSADAHSAVVAEHTVVITNQSDHVQRARVTVYPSEGQSVLKAFDLSAKARFDLVLSDVVKAPFASALVETDGGLVAVSHALDGPVGHGLGQCASSASTSWSFPTGTTMPGARLIYAVFNPFPDQAVVDFDFQVEDDNGRQVPRQTEKLTGRVVKPGQVLPLEITDVVQVRNRLSTHIQVRGNRGRVVVDQILLVDGDHGAAKQLAVGLGAPAPMDSWLFADGEPVGPGVETNIVLFNPGTDTVEADLFIYLDGAVRDGEPFNATVRAGQYLVVPLTKDGRIPQGVGYWALAHSRRGGPIVAAREQKVSAPAARPGQTTDLGSPLLADRWIAPIGGLAQARTGGLTIVNPSSTNDVTITVSSVIDGTATPLDIYNKVILGARQRTVVDLVDPLTPGVASARSMRVDSTGPVVAEQSFSWIDPATRASLVVLPARDSLAVPDSSDIEPRTNPSNPAGLLPGSGSVIPGDVGPGTLVPGTFDPGTLVPNVSGTDVGPIPPVAADAGTAPSPGTDVNGRPASSTSSTIAR